MPTRPSFALLFCPRTLLALVSILILTLGVSTPAHAAVVGRSSQAVVASPVNPSPVYRFYKSDGSHFFTINESEKDQLLAMPNSGYQYEGVAYYAFTTQVAGTQPIYRFYKFAQGVHFFTINSQEADGLKATAANTYRYEGISWYAYTSQVADSSPVYRFYKFQQGVHFYTANANEANQLQANAASTYRFEGIAYYRPTTLTFTGNGGSGGTGDGGTFITPNDVVVRATITTSPGTTQIIVKPTELVGLAGSADVGLSRNSAGTSSHQFQGRGRSTSLDVFRADGPWKVVFDMPDASAGVITQWAGTTSTTTDMFTTYAGIKTIHFTFNGPAGSHILALLIDSMGLLGPQVLYDMQVPPDGSPISGTFNTLTPTPFNNWVMDVEVGSDGYDTTGDWTISMG